MLVWIADLSGGYSYGMGEDTDIIPSGLMHDFGPQCVYKNHGTYFDETPEIHLLIIINPTGSQKSHFDTRAYPSELHIMHGMDGV
jgi:hypothetical protein